MAAPREREPEPVAEHSRPIPDHKQVIRYGLEEQLNCAEEVIASALCAAELDELKTMNDARSIRALLATAAKREMYVHQMDVHNAFLNGKLDEDIYMC